MLCITNRTTLFFFTIWITFTRNHCTQQIISWSVPVLHRIITCCQCLINLKKVIKFTASFKTESSTSSKSSSLSFSHRKLAFEKHFWIVVVWTYSQALFSQKIASSIVICLRISVPHIRLFFHLFDHVLHLKKNIYIYRNNRNSSFIYYSYPPHTMTLKDISRKCKDIGTKCKDSGKFYCVHKLCSTAGIKLRHSMNKT